MEVAVWIFGLRTSCPFALQSGESLGKVIVALMRKLAVSLWYVVRGEVFDSRKLFNVRAWGMVERECLQGDTRTVEQRYFINSIPPQAKPFAHAVRGHWGSRIPRTGDWMSCLATTQAVSVREMARRL